MLQTPLPRSPLVPLTLQGYDFTNRILFPRIGANKLTILEGKKSLVLNISRKFEFHFQPREWRDNCGTQLSPQTGWKQYPEGKPPQRG